MKTVLASLVVAAMAFSANAATFAWGTGTTAVQFPTGTTVTDGSAMGYLVYLGNTGSELYSIAGFAVADPVVDSKASTSTGLAMFYGRISDPFQQDMGTELGGSGENFVNGAVFGMYIVKDGWINIAANTYTVSGLVDDTSTLANANFTFNWTQNAPGVAATSGGGWAAVPEPATAALALAGLALLIRRRK